MTNLDKKTLLYCIEILNKVSIVEIHGAIDKELETVGCTNFQRASVTLVTSTQLLNGVVNPILSAKELLYSLTQNQ
jgi:hypothetical protein